MPVLNTFTDWRDEVFDTVGDITSEVFGGPVKDFLDDFVGIDDDGGIIGSTSEALADINDGVNEILQDDTFVMVATIALASVPGGAAFIPVLQGAATGARGGDFKDIVGSMAKSYLASEVGAYAGEAASQAAIDAGYGTTIANVLGSGSTSAGVALVYGDDPVQAFLTGGASAGVGGALDAMFGNAEGAFGDIAKGTTDTDKVIREVLVANGTAALTGEDANVATVRALANSLPIVSDFVKTASETNNLNETETRLLTNIVQSSIIGTFTDRSISEELMGRLTTEGNKALNEAIGTGVRDAIDKVSGNYAKVADAVSELEEKQAEIQALRDQPKYENLSLAENALKPATDWQRAGYPDQDVKTNGQYWYLRSVDEINDFVDKIQDGSASNYQLDSLFYVDTRTAERVGFELKPSDLQTEDGGFGVKKGLNYVDAKRYLEFLKLKTEKQADTLTDAVDIVQQFNAEARPLYTEMESLSVKYKNAHKELVQDTDKLDEELIFIQDNFQKAVVNGIDPDFDEELYREQNMSGRELRSGKSAFEHFLETGFSEGAPTNQVSLDLNNKAFNDTLTSIANDYALSIGADSFLDLSPETLSYIAQEVDYRAGKGNPEQLQELTLGDIYTGSSRVWRSGKYVQIPPIDEQTQNPIRNSIEFDGLSDREIVDFLSGDLRINVDRNGVVAVDTNRTDTDEYYSNKYGTDVIKKITQEEVPTEDGFEYITKTVITDKNTGAVLDTSEQKDQSFAYESLIDVAPELAVGAINNFSQEAIDMSANYFVKALKAELEESGDSRVLEIVARGGGQALKGIGYTYALLAGAEDDPSRVNLYALAEAMERAGEAATPEDAKAIEEKMSKAIGDAEGLDKVKAFFGNFVDHPTEALIKYVGVEAAGELLPLMVGGAASLTVKLGGKALTKAMAKDLAKEQIDRVAGNAGYSAAIASDMLESFGANAEDTYNEAYKAAIKSGMSEEQAKETAYTKSLSVGVMAAVTTGTLSKFGGGALEKEIFSPKAGINGKELFSAFNNKVKKGVKVTGKESGAEALDEGIINAYKEMELYELDPNRDVTGNIALAATMGAVVGGTISGSVYTGMQTGDIATDILIAGNDKVKKAIRGIGADGSGASNAVEVLQQYGINDPNIVGRALSTQMADPDQVRLTLGEYYEPDGELRAVPYSLDMEQKSGVLEQTLTDYNQNLGYAEQNRNTAEQDQIKNEQALAYVNGERTHKPGFAYTPYTGSNRLNFSYYTNPGKRFQNLDGAREEDYQGYVDTLSNALGNNDSIEIEFPRFYRPPKSELRKAFDAMLGMPYQYGFKNTGDVYGGTFTRDMMDKVREDLESMRRVHEMDLQRIQDRVDNPTDVSEDIARAERQEEIAEQKLQQFMEITGMSNREDAIELAQSPDFSVESLYGSAVQPVEPSVYTSEQELPDPEIFIPTEDVDPVEEIIVPTEDVEPIEEISVPTDDTITGPDVVIPTTPDQVLDDIIDSDEEILVPTEDEVVVPDEEIVVPTEDVEPTEEVVVPTEDVEVDPDLEVPIPPLEDLVTDDEIIPVEDEVVPEEEIVVPTEDVEPEEEVIVPVEEDYEVPQEVIDLVTESRDETVDLVSDLEESIIGDINALTDSGLSRDEAIAKLADDLGSTEQSIRDVIEASEQATSDLIDSLSEGIDADIDAVNQSIDDLVETGLSRDEAISQIASDLGETEESLRQAIDSAQEQTSELLSDLEENVGQDIADAIAASEETTGDLISELSESIGGEIDTIADSITALEESGSTRDEAIAQIAEDLGTTSEELAEALAASEEATGELISGLEESLGEEISAVEESLGEDISGLEESLGGEIDTISEAISALQEAGKTSDEAIAQVAENLGTTEENLKDAIASVESGVATSIEEAISASEEGITKAIESAISASEETTGKLIDDLGTALEGSISDAISSSETATGELISALEESVGTDIKSITDTIDGLTQSGSDRDEAIATVAKNLGTTEESLREAISASEEATKGVISDLEGAIGDNIDGIEDQIQNLEDQGIARDEAIQAVADSIISEETLQGLIAESVSELDLTSEIEEELQALSDAIAELQQEFEMPEGSLDVEQGAPGEFYFGQVESLEPIINTQTGEATGDQMVTVRVGDELLDPVPVSSLADSNLRIIGNDVVRADYKPVAVETSERDFGPVLTEPVYDYSDLPGFENVPTGLPDLTPEQDSELNRIVARSATDNLLRAQDVEEARRAGIDPNTLRTAFSNYRIGAFTEEPEEPDDLSDIMLGIPDYDMDPFGIEFGDIDFSIPERQRPRFYSPPIMPRSTPPRRTPTPFDFGDRGIFNFPGAPEYGAPPTRGTDFYRDFGQFIASEGMARELQRPLIDPETGALIPSQYAPAYMGPRSLIEETGEGMYIDPVLAGLEPE